MDDRILLPDRFERWLAYAASVLLVVAAIALLKGRSHWAELPLAVWMHLTAVFLALALTPVMLLRRRGDRWHRVLGGVWIAAMFVTALISFNIRLINHGNFSPIHALSVFVMISAPLALIRARQGKVAQHRSAVRGMVTGGLLIAGFFTFPFGRLLGTWLFS